MARWPAWRIASVEQTGARLASGSLRSDQSWTAGIAGEMSLKGTAAADPGLQADVAEVSHAVTGIRVRSAARAAARANAQFNPVQIAEDVCLGK